MTRILLVFTVLLSLSALSAAPGSAALDPTDRAVGFANEGHPSWASHAQWRTAPTLMSDSVGPVLAAKEIDLRDVDWAKVKPVKAEQVSAAANGEDEEENGEEEGADGGDEEEEAEAGWDRRWDAPKLA